ALYAKPERSLPIGRAHRHRTDNGNLVAVIDDPLEAGYQELAPRVVVRGCLPLRLGAGAELPEARINEILLQRRSQRRHKFGFLLDEALLQTVKRTIGRNVISPRERVARVLVDDLPAFGFEPTEFLCHARKLLGDAAVVQSTRALDASAELARIE